MDSRHVRFGLSVLCLLASAIAGLWYGMWPAATAIAVWSLVTGLFAADYQE